MNHYRPRRIPLEPYQVHDLLSGVTTWGDTRIAERREAVRQLTESGASAIEIADRFHVSERTITRARRAMREGNRYHPHGPVKVVIHPQFRKNVPDHVRKRIGL